MTRIGAAVVLVLLLAAGAAASGAGRPSHARGNHLFVVPDAGAPAVALAKTDARVVAGYSSFTLVEAGGEDSARLAAAGAEPRDDMTQVRVGRRVIDPARDRAPLTGKNRRPRRPGYALVQFVGPIKDAWLARLWETGVRVVTYMAQNAYLVHGSRAELARAAALLGADRSVRAVVPYGGSDKLAPGVRSEGRQRLAIQTLTGSDGASARREARELGRESRDPSSVGAFRTQYVVADAAEALELAAGPGVVAILPAPQPELHDEAQNQILAGNVVGSDPLVPSGVGYLDFVDGVVGTAQFPFAVDVTDEGIDGGVVGTTHPDFHQNGDAGAPTRLQYVDNFTSDADARDCGGHGTINAGIVGGFNDGHGSSGASAVEDADGFNYGLGIAPRALIGGSKIFKCGGAFSLSSSFTALTTNAYNKGARISSNSWGCDAAGCLGSYNSESQEYDSLVRDAVPGTPGNQQMVEVFASGNTGSNDGTVNSPGTAKNVITVGASENVRAMGLTDGCGISDSGADDARDVIGFSSRGPTDDGRVKPDVVGPGTHDVGPEPQHGSYVGDGVCNADFPFGSTLYSESSGTSHSTPAVAGMAALVRKWYTDNPGAGNGTPPSPAMTKAILAQSGTDLAGGSDGAGGSNASVPDTVQGWGLPNLKRSLASTGRFFHDQQQLLGASGQSFTQDITVQDTTKPVRITLAWTDAPGPTTGNSWVNDLDLSVTAGTDTYRGNVFSGGQSVTGGSPDPANNLESVYLPAGTSGTLTLRVDATNIAGDGVPGNGDSTDQDFALTASNNEPAPTPAVEHESSSVSDADADGGLEPGESFTVSTGIRNSGAVGLSGITGTLAGPASTTINDGSAAWPDLAPAQTASNSDSLSGTLSAGATCGARVDLALSVTSAQGATVEVPVSVPAGNAASPLALNGSEVPKPIPDPGSTNSTLAISEPGVIRDVNVRIGTISHPWVGDLKVDLTAPDGTTVNLFSRPGGPGNDDNDLQNVTFDDEAPSAIGPPNPGVDATPAYSGAFRPQADQLSRLDGGPQNGPWKLTVADTFDDDAGTLVSWGTDVSRALCGPPPGSVEGLAATSQPAAVALDWDDTPAATSYKVFRRNPDGSYPGTATATSTSSAFTDTGRTGGTQYCYRVRASNGGGDGPSSGEACATAQAAAGGGSETPAPGAETPPLVEGPGLPALPRLDLSKVPGAIRVSRRGLFVIAFDTNRAGTLSLRRGRLRVAARTFGAPAQGVARVRLRLRRAHLRRLRRARRLRVTLSVRAGELSATRTVSLRPPKPRNRS